MKKLLIVLVSALFLSASLVNAQKTKQTSGDLGFLKGQKEIKIEYVYDNLTVGKISENDYIAKKVKEKNEKEAGRGDKWKSEWFSDRESKFQPKFEELLNKYLGEKGLNASPKSSNATYVMVVHTTLIEPGYNIGISRQSAYVNYEITFKEISSSKELAVITIIKSPGSDVMGYDFDSGSRISESYAKCGKELGKFLIKNAKI